MKKLHKEDKCNSCRRIGYMGYAKRDIQHIDTGAKWIEYQFGCSFCNVYDIISKEIFENYASMLNIHNARAVNS